MFHPGGFSYRSGGGQGVDLVGEHDLGGGAQHVRLPVAGRRRGVVVQHRGIRLFPSAWVQASSGLFFRARTESINRSTTFSGSVGQHRFDRRQRGLGRSAIIGPYQ
jgi:hypothetical protein